MNLKIISVIIILITICVILRHLRKLHQNFEDGKIDEKKGFLDNFFKYNNYPRILENEIQVKKFPNDRRIIIQDLTKLSKIPVFKIKKNFNLNQNQIRYQLKNLENTNTINSGVLVSNSFVKNKNVKKYGFVLNLDPELSEKNNLGEFSLDFTQNHSFNLKNLDNIKSLTEKKSYQDLERKTVHLYTKENASLDLIPYFIKGTDDKEVKILIRFLNAQNLDYLKQFPDGRFNIVDNNLNIILNNCQLGNPYCGVNLLTTSKILGRDGFVVGKMDYSLNEYSVINSDEYEEFLKLRKDDSQKEQNILDKLELEKLIDNFQNMTIQEQKDFYDTLTPKQLKNMETSNDEKIAIFFKKMINEIKPSSIRAKIDSGKPLTPQDNKFIYDFIMKDKLELGNRDVKIIKDHFKRQDTKSNLNSISSSSNSSNSNISTFIGHYNLIDQVNSRYQKMKEHFTNEVEDDTKFKGEKYKLYSPQKYKVCQNSQEKEENLKKYSDRKYSHILTEHPILSKDKKNIDKMKQNFTFQCRENAQDANSDKKRYYFGGTDYDGQTKCYGDETFCKVFETKEDCETLEENLKSGDAPSVDSSSGTDDFRGDMVIENFENSKNSKSYSSNTNLSPKSLFKDKGIKLFQKLFGRNKYNIQENFSTNTILRHKIMNTGIPNNFNNASDFVKKPNDRVSDSFVNTTELDFDLKIEFTLAVKNFSSNWQTFFELKISDPNDKNNKISLQIRNDTTARVFATIPEYRHSWYGYWPSKHDNFIVTIKLTGPENAKKIKFYVSGFKNGNNVLDILSDSAWGGKNNVPKDFSSLTQYEMTKNKYCNIKDIKYLNAQDIPILDDEAKQRNEAKQAKKVITDTGKTVENAVVATGKTVKKEVVATGETVKQEVLATGETVKQEVVDTGETVKQEVLATGEKTSQAITATGEKTSQAITATGETVKQEVVDTGEKASQAITDTGATTIKDIGGAQLTATAAIYNKKIALENELNAKKYILEGELDNKNKNLSGQLDIKSESIQTELNKKLKAARNIETSYISQQVATNLILLDKYNAEEHARYLKKLEAQALEGNRQKELSLKMEKIGKLVDFDPYDPAQPGYIGAELEDDFKKYNFMNCIPYQKKETTCQHIVEKKKYDFETKAPKLESQTPVDIITLPNLKKKKNDTFTPRDEIINRIQILEFNSKQAKYLEEVRGLSAKQIEDYIQFQFNQPLDLLIEPCSEEYENINPHKIFDDLHIKFRLVNILDSSSIPGFEDIYYTSLEIFKNNESIGYILDNYEQPVRILKNDKIYLYLDLDNKDTYLNIEIFSQIVNSDSTTQLIPKTGKERFMIDRALGAFGDRINFFLQTNNKQIFNTIHYGEQISQLTLPYDPYIKVNVSN